MVRERRAESRSERDEEARARRKGSCDAGASLVIVLAKVAMVVSDILCDRGNG